MSSVIIFNLLLLTTVLAQIDYYDRKYDYFDIDYFVNNPRLLRKYLDCFLDHGPCPPIGRVFKRVLPEVIQTACAKCSPPQQRFTKRAFDAFKSSLPDKYEELHQKYDPRDLYFNKFEKTIANS